MEKYKLELNKESSKYLQIYNYIKKLIIDNKIKEHEKLPPIRKLANYMKVNNATIVKVYELLEKEGYVYKIVGSGTFVSNMKLKKEKQLSFLFICHDLALIQMFCDRVIVMHDGHVEEEGTPEEIIEHPKTEYTEQLIRSVL